LDKDAVNAILIAFAASFLYQSLYLQQDSAVNEWYNIVWYSYIMRTVRMGT